MFSGTNFNISRGPGRRRGRTFFGSVTHPRKEPLGKGIFFAVTAGILIVTGGILTYLGFSDSFRKRLSTIGPLLIGLALLLILFSVRQFLLLRKIQQSNSEDCQLGRSSVTTMVIERDAEGTVTVVMDMIDPDAESGERQEQTECEQTECEVVRPPSYTEVVESSVADDWFPEGDPPPTYDEALQDSEPCDATHQDRHGVNEAWSTSQTQANSPEVTG